MISTDAPIPEREPVFHVRDEPHFETIGSAVRLEMLEYFRSRGPMAVSELSALMDRPADGLYHHLKKLESCGMVRVVGARQAGRQIERVYDAAADEYRVAEDSEHLVRIWRLISSHAERQLAAALEDGLVHYRGESRNSSMRVETAQLDPQALAEVLAHLDAIRAVFSRSRTQTDGEPFTLTFALTPSAGKGRSRTGPDRGVSHDEVKKTRSRRKQTGTPPKKTPNPERPTEGVSAKGSSARIRTKRRFSS